MPRGGSRNGSGRPKGAKTQNHGPTEEQRRRWRVEPLEVMMEALAYYHEQGNRDKAILVAQMAAPYCHPRLSYVKADVTQTDHEENASLDLELARLVAGSQAADDHASEMPS